MLVEHFYNRLIYVAGIARGWYPRNGVNGIAPKCDFRVGGFNYILGKSFFFYYFLFKKNAFLKLRCFLSVAVVHIAF